MLAAIGPDPVPSVVTSRRRPLVLLVDDCSDTRTLYAEYLDLAGFDVKEAGDGLAALTQASSAIPDIVVMDLGLPGLGGREVAERLKTDPVTRAIPVIIVSGYAREAMEQGAVPWDEYVGKPCVPDHLVETIGRLLERRRGESAGEVRSSFGASSRGADSPLGES